MKKYFEEAFCLIIPYLFVFFVNKITARRISPTGGVWSAIQRLVFGYGFQIGFGITVQYQLSIRHLFRFSMKLDKKDLKPLHGARKNIKKVRKSLVTSGFFKKSGDIFFGATSQKEKSHDSVAFSFCSLHFSLFSSHSSLKSV